MMNVKAEGSAAIPAATGFDIDVPSFLDFVILGSVFDNAAPRTASPTALYFGTPLATGLNLLRVPVASAEPIQNTFGSPIDAGNVMGLFRPSLEAEASTIMSLLHAFIIASRMLATSFPMPQEMEIISACHSSTAQAIAYTI